MALSFSNLFADLGKLIKHYDAAKADAADLTTDFGEILTRFTTGGTLNTLPGLFATRDSWRSQHTARRSALVAMAQARILDQETIRDELFTASTQIDEVLSLLRAAMREAGTPQSINASAVTLGTVTANSGNASTGAKLLATTTLDGYSSPGSVSGRQIRAQLDYAGLASELAVPTDTVTVECTADSQSGGKSEGAETFRVYGSTADAADGVGDEGFGAGGSFTGLHGYSLAQNLDFETFTTNTPANWTVTAGTAGTHIFEDATTFNHGAKCLKLTAASSPSAIALKQTLTPANFNRARLYCLSFWYKGEASIASGDLTVKLIGTGMTSIGVTVAPAALSSATSWTHASAFVLIPDNVPTDFALEIRWASNPTNTKTIRVDDIAIGPVFYVGGIGLAWRRGSAIALANDRWTFTVANSEGVIQRFFRRAFGVQLPSNAAGGETIADSLAT